MTTLSLIVRKGTLCLPNGDEVMRILPSGDVTGFQWPGDFRLLELQEALGDAREMGEIPNIQQVTLPDGMTIDI